MLLIIAWREKEEGRKEEREQVERLWIPEVGECLK